MDGGWRSKGNLKRVDGVEGGGLDGPDADMDREKIWSHVLDEAVGL